MTIEANDSALHLNLPLPLFESVRLGTQVSRDGDPFTLVAGLSSEIVQQLVAYSRDEKDTELHKNTNDKDRFAPPGAYEAWYAKERTPFALVSGRGKLAALAWYGPAPVPHEGAGEGLWDTAGFRSYEPYRGKGLMTEFIAYTWEIYQRTFPTHRLWIETNADNEGALKLYRRLGFIEYGVGDKGRLVLIKQ